MSPNRTHPLFNRASSQQSQASLNQSSCVNIGETIPAKPTSTTSTTISHRNSITTSFIWDHGLRSDSPAGRRWNCSYCRTNPSAATTSTAMSHLKKVHGITETGKLSSNQSTIKDSNKPVIKAAALRKLIIEWIIDRRHAFNEVEAESFRKIFKYIDIAIISKLPWSANTIPSDSIKYFEESKLVITEHLSTARSNIHLSFDMSTSPNCKALLAITAHWTSSNYKAVATLLAIRELNEKHTGENMAEIVYQVAKEYGIVDKLGSFMMDNATNNNRALKELNSLIQNDRGIGFDPVETRLRCFGHIMNLVVKDLLYGAKKK